MSYNLRITQEYFQPKIGRKIRMFSLGRKNNILIYKKRVYGYGYFLAMAWPEKEKKQHFCVSN